MVAKGENGRKAALRFAFLHCQWALGGNGIGKGEAKAEFWLNLVGEVGCCCLVYDERSGVFLCFYIRFIFLSSLG